ncbi:MAG: large conductance mechanosensitive channel protein MscL [Coriobacteriales bacterium]|nr:large conductance mechanosensitive channel protein MscL [Coriobacteriales bacterium]
MHGLWNEFKSFIARGNVMDLAVAVIVGGAFTAILNSLVNDILTPLLSLLTAGINFSALSFTLGLGNDAAVLTYGKFIQAVINFFVFSLVIFLMIKAINKVSNKKPTGEQTKTCPYCAEEIPRLAVRCPKCTTVLDESKMPAELRTNEVAPKPF